MFLEALSVLATVGRGLFTTTEVVTGACLAFNTAGLVWRGIRALAHAQTNKTKTKFSSGRVNKHRRVKVQGRKTLGRRRESLGTIWKKKSSLVNRRRTKGLINKQTNKPLRLQSNAIGFTVKQIKEPSKTYSDVYHEFASGAESTCTSDQNLNDAEYSDINDPRKIIETTDCQEKDDFQ